MSELKRMEIKIHHEKHAAEHQQKHEERELRRSVEREAEELKSLSVNR